VKEADNSVLVRFAYTRDAGGNPIAIERESGLGVFYYAYDALQRLSYEGQFVDAARQYENYYEYDPAGNRSLLRHGETGAEDLTYYDYNAANELTDLHHASGWTYFAYDANGNAVSEQTPSYTRYFDWDGRDMLAGVRSTEGGWTDNEIRYDGMAHRAALVDSTGMTYYAWDGIRVLKTEDGAGSLRQRQVHGYAPIPSVGDIALIESAAGDPYAPIPDQVGTNWKLLDSAADVANSYQYDAFGVGRSASETFSNPYRFAGKPLDPDPTHYHFIARQYVPRLARFDARDPLAVGIGSQYVAFLARPASVADPTGKVECKDLRGKEPIEFGTILHEHLADIRALYPEVHCPGGEWRAGGGAAASTLYVVSVQRTWRMEFRCKDKYYIADVLHKCICTEQGKISKCRDAPAGGRTTQSLTLQAVCVGDYWFAGFGLGLGGTPALFKTFTVAGAHRGQDLARDVKTINFGLDVSLPIRFLKGMGPAVHIDIHSTSGVQSGGVGGGAGLHAGVSIWGRTKINIYGCVWTWHVSPGPVCGAGWEAMPYDLRMLASPKWVP